ncbi:MAG: response regulator [Betaproteobacteria bacterium]
MQEVATFVASHFRVISILVRLAGSSEWQYPIAVLTLKTTQSSVLLLSATSFSVNFVILSVVRGDVLSIRICRFGRRALGVVLLLSLLLCASLPLAAAPNIRVGVYDTKPLLFVENGLAKGLFVDVLDHIAKQEGWQLEYVPGTWVENLKRLNDGEIDLLSTIAYSEERAKTFSFPKEFVVLDWGVIWQHPGGSIQSVPDLANKKLAILEGDIYASGILKLLEQFQIPVELVIKESYIEVFKAISREEVDAGAAGNLQDAGLLEGQSVIRTPILYTPVRLTYAALKGKNEQLVSTLDDHIARMKTDKVSVLNIKAKEWLENSERGLSIVALAWLLTALGAISLLTGFVVLLRRQVRVRTKSIVQAKEELAALSQRLLMATDSAKLGVWDWNVRDDTMLWDDRMYELYGVARENSPNTIEAWVNGLHPEDKERALAECQAALQGEKDFDTSFRVLHSSDEVRHIKANGLVIRGADGQAERMLGINVDITARKHQEAELLEAHQRLTLQFEQAPLGFVEWDRGFRIVKWNPAAERIFGYTCSEAMGHDASFIFPDIETASVSRKINDLLEGVSFDRSSNQNLRKDGSIIDCRWYNSSLRDNQGQVVGVISLVEDVTERKLAQQELEHYRQHLEHLVETRTEELAEAKLVAEAANTSKSTFLANMSHEIRTPLNAIIGMTHILRRSELSSVQADRLGKINIAADHLLSLINDILDLSKIEAGKVALDYVSFNIDELLGNIRSIVLDRAQAKGLVFKIEKSSSLQGVHGDPMRLQQALLNYVGNAIKFTETGSITVRVNVQREHDDSVLIRFEVQDTGIGIPQEAVSRMFMPFEQADKSTTRKYGGTGLGLAITKRIAELMGGEVGVTSTLGVGSTFWISVCLPKRERRSETRPKLAEAESEQLIRLRHHAKIVLLVDDEPSNLEIAKLYLEEAGLVIHCAENGADAVSKVQHNSYALILMDMQMPKMDGIEATKTIRKMPGYEGVPILAMTANAFTEDKTRCFQAGMNDFLSKPFHPNVLFGKVLKWLDATSLPNPINSSLLIGLPLIDGEHAELFNQLDMISGMTEIITRGNDFLNALDQLGAQLKAHFTNEERVLKSLNMPIDMVVKHVNSHIQILEDFAHLQLDLMQGNVPSRPELLQMVKAWIIDHVNDYDLEINKYLKRSDQ